MNVCIDVNRLGENGVFTRFVFFIFYTPVLNYWQYTDNLCAVWYNLIIISYWFDICTDGYSGTFVNYV